MGLNCDSHILYSLIDLSGRHSSHLSWSSITTIWLPQLLILIVGMCLSKSTRMFHHWLDIFWSGHAAVSMMPLYVIQKSEWSAKKQQTQIWQRKKWIKASIIHKASYSLSDVEHIWIKFKLSHQSKVKLERECKGENPHCSIFFHMLCMRSLLSNWNSYLLIPKMIHMVCWLCSDSWISSRLSDYQKSNWWIDYFGNNIWFWHSCNICQGFIAIKVLTKEVVCKYSLDVSRQ